MKKILTILFLLLNICVSTSMCAAKCSFLLGDALDGISFSMGFLFRSISELFLPGSSNYDPGRYDDNVSPVAKNTVLPIPYNTLYQTEKDYNNHITSQKTKFKADKIASEILQGTYILNDKRSSKESLDCILETNNRKMVCYLQLLLHPSTREAAKAQLPHLEARHYNGLLYEALTLYTTFTGRVANSTGIKATAGWFMDLMVQNNVFDKDDKRLNTLKDGIGEAEKDLDKWNRIVDFETLLNKEKDKIQKRLGDRAKELKHPNSSDSSDANFMVYNNGGYQYLILQSSEASFGFAYGVHADGSTYYGEVILSNLSNSANTAPHSHDLIKKDGKGWEIAVNGAVSVGLWYDGQILCGMKITKSLIEAGKFPIDNVSPEFRKISMRPGVLIVKPRINCTHTPGISEKIPQPQIQEAYYDAIRAFYHQRSYFVSIAYALAIGCTKICFQFGSPKGLNSGYLIDCEDTFYCGFFRRLSLAWEGNYDLRYISETGKLVLNARIPDGTFNEHATGFQPGDVIAENENLAQTKIVLGSYLEEDKIDTDGKELENLARVNYAIYTTKPVYTWEGSPSEIETGFDGLLKKINEAYPNLSEQKIMKDIEPSRTGFLTKEQDVQNRIYYTWLFLKEIENCKQAALDYVAEVTNQK